MKPLVVLVPDVFGSHLRDAAGRVWIDDEALAAGGLRRLAFSARDVNARRRHRRDLPDAGRGARPALRGQRLRLRLATAAGDRRSAGSRGGQRRIEGRGPPRCISSGTGGAAWWPWQRRVDADASGNAPAAAVPRRHPRRTIRRQLGSAADAGRHASSREDAGGDRHPAGNTGQRDLSCSRDWPGLNECRPDGTHPPVPAAVLPLLSTVAGTGVPTCVNAGAAPDAAAPRRYLFHADGDGMVAAASALIDGTAERRASKVRTRSSSPRQKRSRSCLEQLAQGMRGIGSRRRAAAGRATGRPRGCAPGSHHLGRADRSGHRRARSGHARLSACGLGAAQPPAPGRIPRRHRTLSRRHHRQRRGGARRRPGRAPQPPAGSRRLRRSHRSGGNSHACRARTRLAPS